MKNIDVSAELVSGILKNAGYEAPEKLEESTEVDAVETTEDEVDLETLTEEEIAQIMRGNLSRAWNPSPKRGSGVDVEQAAGLSFNAGDGAVAHDVYLGTTPVAVENALADASVSPEYLGRYEETSVDVADQVQMGRTYYWRVDEIGSDGALTKGRVWSFNVVDYLVLEDFESYDDADNPVFNTWMDGFSEDSGNGTGSVVGHLNPPYMETENAHGGVGQSVPFRYNNRGISRLAYSEMSRTFETAQDFTRLGITHLQLSFYADIINDPGRLYVALEDASGQVADVAHPDESMLAVLGWHDWNAALSDFAGIDLQAIKVIHLGVGNRSNPTAGGTGDLLFDDILLTVAE